MLAHTYNCPDDDGMDEDDTAFDSWNDPSRFQSNGYDDQGDSGQCSGTCSGAEDGAMDDEPYFAGRTSSITGTSAVGSQS